MRQCKYRAFENLLCFRHIMQVYLLHLPLLHSWKNWQVSSISTYCFHYFHLMILLTNRLHPPSSFLSLTFRSLSSLGANFPKKNVAPSFLKSPPPTLERAKKQETAGVPRSKVLNGNWHQDFLLLGALFTAHKQKGG